MYDKLYALIKAHEGFRAKAYLCPAGVPTIGYGSTGRDIYIGMKPVSKQWAEDRMKQDVDQFVLAALKASPILALYPDKLCAIADFCYNLGTTRYMASTLRKKVNCCKWEEASRELSKWVWGGGKKLPGLIARRLAEQNLLR